MAYQAPSGQDPDALLCFICDQPFASMSWRKLDEDRTAHPSCFRCDSCNVTIDGKYHEADDGSFYCVDNGCVSKLFGSLNAVPISAAPEQLLCFLCDQPFTDISWKILDEDRRAHPQCFKCDLCGFAISGKYTEAEDGSFYCVDNGCVTKIYGQNTNVSFHIEKQKDPCWICQGQLGGSYMVDEDGHKYHNACFKCYDCNTLLKEEYFQEGNKFWCKECRINKRNSDFMAATYQQMDAALKFDQKPNASPFGKAPIQNGNDAANEYAQNGEVQMGYDEEQNLNVEMPINEQQNSGHTYTLSQSSTDEAADSPFGDYYNKSAF